MWALAHEVYVLDEATIEQALRADSPNPFDAYWGNEYRFFFWGFVTFVVTSTVLFASFFRAFEAKIGPLFVRLKRFAHPLVRLTVGATLLAFAYHGILWGPELPLEKVFGLGADLSRFALAALGFAALAGIYTRFTAFLLIALWVYAALLVGSYSLGYIMHLGAYAVLLLLGGGYLSVDHSWYIGHTPKIITRMCHHLAPLAFPILRLSFGFSIMFAAVYAKFLHSQLALEVVYAYDLTNFFHLEPLFIVLGAFIIEFLAGLMIALGVEVRWTALFLVFWLTLAHLSMNEGWWVHIVLYGLGFAIFFHGYDRFSLEGRYLKRRTYEPVL